MDKRIVALFRHTLDWRKAAEELGTTPEDLRGEIISDRDLWTEYTRTLQAWAAMLTYEDIGRRVPKMNNDELLRLLGIYEHQPVIVASSGESVRPERPDATRACIDCGKFFQPAAKHDKRCLECSFRSGELGRQAILRRGS
jgi:hypothetical protein